MFLASPANLNDPFDALLPFRYKQEDLSPENIYKKLIDVGRKEWPEMSELELQELAYKRQQSGVFENGDYWKAHHEESKKSMHESFGILSCTTKNDNLLMWAHYADCHRGFCVGLNSEILFNTVKGAIGRVLYSESSPTMPLFGQNTSYMVEMLNTKSPEWEYEDEYRLTKIGVSNLPLELPKEAITEVILGCNMSQENRKEIIDIVDTKLPHVKIFNATTSLEYFRLNISEAAKMK